MKHVYLLIILWSATAVFSQNTVGLLSYDPLASFDGYNLIYPHNQPNVYLLNNCGELIHSWTDESESRPGNTAYLLDDGRLVKTKRSATTAGDPIFAPGAGATVEIRDWDNNLEWSFTLNDSLARLHHDIEPLPNGHILMVAWERKSLEEAIAAGRDSNSLDIDELWPDYVFEINPSTDSIVWEWHSWDHLIQDLDDSKNNFGVVQDHPELINVNFDSDGAADWMHVNAVDYNADLDQVLLCSPFLNEIWIIDHSTTSAQAASRIGGMAGRGGDLLYRWGNPQSYDAGVPEDQLLFNAHDAHWIDDFLDATHPDFGKIIVFNNQAGIDFSQVNIFTLPWDMYSWAYTHENQAWGPFNYDATITHPTRTNIFSTGLSSVQVLPNGNYLICSGRQGYTIELTPTSEIVWEYVTPLRGGSSATQGDSLNLNANLTFRNKRYPSDFSAFENRTFLTDTWIELEPDSSFCDLISPVRESTNIDLQIYPNPASDMTILQWRANLHTSVEIFDLIGNLMLQMEASGGRTYLDISQWPNGIYVVRVADTAVRRLLVENQ